MNVYEGKTDQDIIKQIEDSLQKETGSKVFTISILNRDEDADEIECIIVFEDKRILHGFIVIQMIEDNPAVRIRGNYL